ncbi:tetratricopeptide repeat protein [Candidatus Dependentiae bacterium]|nr:tetratricopeptide repeat protein [Candidatus Dependentiae bacterium]
MPNMIPVLLFFFSIIIYPVASEYSVYTICIVLALFNLIIFHLKKINEITFSAAEIYYCVVFIGFPLFSNAYTINTYLTVLGIYKNFSYFLLLLLLKNSFDKGINNNFFLLIPAVVFLNCVYGIFQINTMSARLTALYINPNLLADTINFALLFLIFFYSKKKVQVILLVFLSIFLIMTKSLGAITALMFLFFIMMMFIAKKIYRVSYKVLIPAILILLSILLFTAYLRYDRTFGDIFGNRRLEIINASFKSLSHNFFLGTGHNTYETKIKRFVFPIKNSDLKYVKKQRNPHNFFLHLANETGIINLTILTVLILVLFFETLFSPIKMKLLGCSGIFLILVHHSADIGYDTPLIHYFFVFFIFCITYASRPLLKIAFKKWMKIFIYISFLAIFIVLPCLNLCAEITAERGRNLFDSNNYEKAADKFNFVIRIIPDYPEILQRLAGCYRGLYYKTNNVKYIEKTLQCFFKGAEADPYNGYYKMNIAKALSEFCEPEKSKSQIKFFVMQALNVEPFFALMYLEAAELLFSINNPDLALNYARRGLIIEPYFLRLNLIYRYLDNNQKDRFDISVRNIAYYMHKRIKILKPDINPADKNYELYYFEIMYNTKINFFPIQLNAKE